MDKTQQRISTTNLSRKYREEHKSHKATKNDLRTLQIKYDNLMELHNGVVNDYHEQAKVVEDLRNRFITGGVVYTVNGDYVSSAIEIPPYSEWTYTQEIPTEIGTVLYSKIPFVKVIDRQLVEDAKQKLKYRGVN